MKHIRDNEHDYENEYSTFKSVLCLVVLTFLLSMLAGCASITHGTSQTITVETRVPCTAVRDGVEITVTPEWNVIQLDRSESPIELTCGDSVKTIESNVSGAAWTSILFIDFGLIDYMTGAMWQYPDTVVVE